LLISSLGLSLSITSFILIVKYFSQIWEASFVAALLFGSIAFLIKSFFIWLYKNIIIRRMCNTMCLSRENKEATPVLEWFKAWLPNYINSQNIEFNNISPLFRKRDGKAFFKYLQDTRNSNIFTLSYWVTPGTHIFKFVGYDGHTSTILMHYYISGDLKKQDGIMNLFHKNISIYICLTNYKHIYTILEKCLTWRKQCLTKEKKIH
jgi:hypothetical protein